MKTVFQQIEATKCNKSGYHANFFQYWTGRSDTRRRRYNQKAKVKFNLSALCVVLLAKLKPNCTFLWGNKGIFPYLYWFFRHVWEFKRAQDKGPQKNDHRASRKSHCQSDTEQIAALFTLPTTREPKEMKIYKEMIGEMKIWIRCIWPARWGCHGNRCQTTTRAVELETRALLWGRLVKCRHFGEQKEKCHECRGRLRGPAHIRVDSTREKQILLLLTCTWCHFSHFKCSVQRLSTQATVKKFPIKLLSCCDVGISNTDAIVQNGQKTKGDGNLAIAVRLKLEHLQTGQTGFFVAAAFIW